MRIDPERIAAARTLYLEGYLWDPDAARVAMLTAMDAARAAGTKVAFTLSDSFVVERHRADLLALLDQGRIDILFANESEILSLAGETELNAAVAAIAPKVTTLVVTRSEHGALAVRGGETRRSPGRADRTAGRHDRRGRPVRGRLPRRRSARASALNAR